MVPGAVQNVNERGPLRVRGGPTISASGPVIDGSREVLAIEDFAMDS